MKIKKQLPEVKTSKAKKGDNSDINELYEDDFDQQVGDYQHA